MQKYLPDKNFPSNKVDDEQVKKSTYIPVKFLKLRQESHVFELRTTYT